MFIDFDNHFVLQSWISAIQRILHYRQFTRRPIAVHGLATKLLTRRRHLKMIDDGFHQWRPFLSSSFYSPSFVSSPFTSPTLLCFPSLFPFPYLPMLLPLPCPLPLQVRLPIRSRTRCILLLP